MAEQQKPNSNDDDLLANAIPIPADELEELEDDDLSVDDAADSSADSDEEEDLEPIDLAGGDDDDDDDGGLSKIRMFGRQHTQEETFTRTVNRNGTGATRMRTFVAKLRMDAMENLDHQINQWLDSHPDYEVKHVTVTVGDLKGKITEPALFMNVWV